MATTVSQHARHLSIIQNKIIFSKTAANVVETSRNIYLKLQIGI